MSNTIVSGEKEKDVFVVGWLADIGVRAEYVCHLCVRVCADGRKVGSGPLYMVMVSCDDRKGYTECLVDVTAANVTTCIQYPPRQSKADNYWHVC